MSAAWLVPVGNRGMYVDASRVVSVARHEQSVVLLLDTGTKLTVSIWDAIARPAGATDGDVAGVVHTLQAGPSAPPHEEYSTPPTAAGTDPWADGSGSAPPVEDPPELEEQLANPGESIE